MAVAPGKAAAQAAVTKDLPLHLKGLRATWGVHGLVLGTAAKLLGKGKPLQAPVLPTRTPGDTKYVTSPEEIERKLQKLHDNRQKWAATPFAERARLAHECARRASKAGARVALLSTQYKGSYESGAGEEACLWLNAVSCLRETGDSLAALAAGRPLQPNAVRVRQSSGKGKEGDSEVRTQAIADVFPATVFEHLLFAGYRGEVWVEPGKPVRVAETVLSRLNGPGELVLILAAGNVSALSITDIASHCLALGCVCAVKLNPVNEYLGPTLEEVCAPLVESGALQFVYGGGEVGARLIQSERVQALHITGSDKTLDAIVWGGKPKVGPPPFTRPITAELGCVTPAIVVPGATEWTEAELRGRAAQLAWMVSANASCNCLATKVLVLSAAWPQRAAFVSALREAVARLAPRACYYPGSREKYQKFREAYPHAQVVGAEPPAESGCLPYLFVEVDAGSAPKDEHGFVNEAWSPVLTIATLPASPAAATGAAATAPFLRAAAQFCNERLWGTLSCTVFAHPLDVSEESGNRGSFEEFLGELRYGSIGVNALSALSFSFNKLSWGAHPGHTLHDIQSGIGQVHNSTFVEDVQKSVLYGPWDPPLSFTDPDMRNTEAMGQRLMDFFAGPSLPRVGLVAAAAVKN